MSEKTKLALAFEKIKEAGEILAGKETTPPEKPADLKLQKEAKLEDGQTIMTPSDDWSEGVEVYLVTGEGDPIRMEEGTFELANGGSITIDAEGKLSAMQMPDEDAPDDEQINAIADKVIEKLGLSKESIATDLSKELEKRDELLAELSSKLVELAKPAVEEKDSKKKLADQTKKPKMLSKEEVAKLSEDERMRYIMSKYQN